MTTVVLVRTHYMDDRLNAFATRLKEEGGQSVYIVADETTGPVEVGNFPKIVLNPRTVSTLRTYGPSDFGWRCGDYGFYLARQKLPEVDYFWMIEPDTRPNWSNYQDLFALFESETADFIAPHFREVGREDFWYPTMRWRSPHVWRCLFGFARLSARAADVCWRERVEARWRPDARLMWPNDETFVSTIVSEYNMVGKDLNEVYAGLCTTESFDFHTPKSGDEFDALQPDDLIYHPVLYGEMYERKVEKMLMISGGRRPTLKQRGEKARLQTLRAWNKLKDGRVPGLS